MRVMQQVPVEKKPTSRIFPFSFDSVWTATMKSISEYPLTIIEKESGIINTDWVSGTRTQKVRIWRGLAFGGMVDDEQPIEIQYKLNILVSSESAESTKVRVIRYAKERPYDVGMGPRGCWQPNTLAEFQQVDSDTQTEHELLNTIGHFLETDSKLDSTGSSK